MDGALPAVVVDGVSVTGLASCGQKADACKK